MRFAGLPAGSKLTIANSGADRTRDSDPDYTGVSAPFTLGVGEPNVRPAMATDDVAADYLNASVDAGITPLRYALGDQVWLDANHDGLHQSEEPAASARRIAAQRPAGGPGDQRHRRCRPLPVLRFAGRTVPAALQRVAAAPRLLRGGSGRRRREQLRCRPSYGGDTGIPARPERTQPGAAADVGLEGVDFVNATASAGLVAAYSIGDTVWRDHNGNGVQDPVDGGVLGLPD